MFLQESSFGYNIYFCEVSLGFPRNADFQALNERDSISRRKVTEDFFEQFAVGAFFNNISEFASPYYFESCAENCVGYFVDRLSFHQISNINFFIIFLLHFFEPIKQRH